MCGYIMANRILLVMVVETECTDGHTVANRMV